MLAWLALSLTLGIHAMVQYDDAEGECIDKSPYCTVNDCNVRPGYALDYCKRTCGNCEPFCYNSFIISCKESRKQECDSMLKDYCPLLCGVCRTRKKKLKIKGSGVKSQTPVSIAKLGILQKFSTSKPSRSSKLEKNTTSVPIIPAVTESSAFPNGPFTPKPIFRQPTEDRDSNPLPFSDTSSLKSSPIVVEEDEKEGSHNEFDLDVVATDNSVFAPEHVRIVLNPPWRRRGPPEHFPGSSRNLGESLIPTSPIKASKKFYPLLSPTRWVFPHQEQSQTYPSTQAFLPKSYSQELYGLPGFGHHLESAEDAPMNLGELIALLGCRDKDPSICSKITDESCLSRPGYYSKLCPVKCRNCNDSIKIDCDKVRRLGGCKLPMAAEYCPKTCRLCALPARIAESLPPCKDELDTCENLAASGVCDHPYSKKALRTYCAKSCGHCRDSQFYMNDALYRRMPRKKQKKPPKLPLG